MTGKKKPPMSPAKPQPKKPPLRKTARPTGPAAALPRIKLPIIPAAPALADAPEPPEGAEDTKPDLRPGPFDDAGGPVSDAQPDPLKKDRAIELTAPPPEEAEEPAAPPPEEEEPAAPPPDEEEPAAPPPTSAPPREDLTAGLPEALAPVRSSFFARWRPRAGKSTEDVVAAGVQQTMDGRPPVVLFRGVTKVYHQGTPKEFTAIRDVSFSVEDIPDKGEFVSILGPSGCGKSTLLRLIAGLEPQHPPTAGRVEVLGGRVRGPGADRGMVFQSYTSFDHRTVLRNVAFGLECRGMRKRERQDLARSWIEKVGLSVKEDAHKYPHQLSGGMQQRVAIARTLALKPRILLMDEPFGALDPATRFNMQDLLISLWNEVQATVFFVTHSIEEAVYLGDRVYIFTRSPGTISCEVKVPRPERPAMETQRDPNFQDVVFQIREMITRFEHDAAEPATGEEKHD